MAFAPLDGPRGAEWLHGRVHVGRMPFAPTRTQKNEPDFTPKKPFGSPKLGRFRLRKRMGEDGLHPYGDQNHTWVSFL